MTSRTAFIALGSNLGDSRAILAQAFAELQKLSSAPLRRSGIYATDPVDCPPGSPRFLNVVAAIEVLPNETPESLMGRLRQLEKEFGRKPKKVLNEARPLDLDLIAFGSETRNTPELTLPHPRAHKRRFVLQPLDELEPELVLPGQRESVAALLRRLPIEPIAIKI